MNIFSLKNISITGMMFKKIQDLYLKKKLVPTIISDRRHWTRCKALDIIF